MKCFMRYEKSKLIDLSLTIPKLLILNELNEILFNENEDFKEKVKGEDPMIGFRYYGCDHSVPFIYPQGIIHGMKKRGFSSGAVDK